MKVTKYLLGIILFMIGAMLIELMDGKNLVEFIVIACIVAGIYFIIKNLIKEKN